MKHQHELLKMGRDKRHPFVYQRQRTRSKTWCKRNIEFEVFVSQYRSGCFVGMVRARLALRSFEEKFCIGWELAPRVEILLGAIAVTLP